MRNELHLNYELYRCGTPLCLRASKAICYHFHAFLILNQKIDACQLFRGQLLTPARKTTVPMKQAPVRALVYSDFPLATKRQHDMLCIFLKLRETGLSVGANNISRYRTQVSGFLIQSFILILLSLHAVSCWHRKGRCSNNIHESILQSGLLLSAWVSHPLLPPSCC